MKKKREKEIDNSIQDQMMKINAVEMKEEKQMIMSYELKTKCAVL